MMNCEGLDMSANVSEKDAGLIKSFESLKAEVATHIEAFEFHLAGEKAYHYAWHTFADVIIEESKAALLGSDELAKRSAQRMLMEILTGSMKMLHPFMPFVTEEIWSKLPIAPACRLIRSRSATGSEALRSRCDKLVLHDPD
jgi:valyl-tRNA synthetase